jgi:hypothetical protein
LSSYVNILADFQDGDPWMNSGPSSIGKVANPLKRGSLSVDVLQIRPPDVESKKIRINLGDKREFDEQESIPARSRASSTITFLQPFSRRHRAA